MLLRTFFWSFATTVVALAGALYLGDWQTFTLVAILCILEVSLSFDNAVINAAILKRMDAWWQRFFLTVGILIAVFGMRLLFPLVLVGVTAWLGPVEVVRLALDGGAIDQPGTYAYILHKAHPMIAAFGGMFLLMIFLDFAFKDRALIWLGWLERPLRRIGKIDQVSVIAGLVLLVVAAEWLAGNPGEVLVAGILGAVLYLLVNAVSETLEADGSDSDDDLAGIHGDAATVQVSLGGRAQPDLKAITGRAALSLFLYLEVLDASFSFDGVIGAFAITQDIFIIATGLGVGAMYIRSLTVYLVRKGTLDKYVYLEHGAHWAIGALAVILLVSIRFEVPEILTGLIGVAFIVAAFVSSVLHNRRGPAGAAEDRRDHLVGAP